MAVPTTGSGNISFFGNNASPPYDGIWSIANPGNPNDSNESLRDLLGYDWFHGPGGGNTVSFSGWGNYTGTSGTAGDSRIYGISANSSNNNQAMSIPAGLEYYYDGTNYRAILSVNNTLPAPVPPRPPDANDVDVNIYFGNPNGNFPYLSGGGQVTPGLPSVYFLDNTGSPLINNGYWYLSASGVSPFFGGALIDLSINGNVIFTGGAVPAAGVFNDDWTNYATIQTMASYLGAIGFVVDVTVY